MEEEDKDPHSHSATFLLPISSCQQHSERVMKVHEGAVWCLTPRPYRRPMESARWPGCERITRLRNNGRIESARLPAPRGDPREASEDLEDLEEGDHPIAIRGEIPTDWTHHPSDQSVVSCVHVLPVCVCLCVCDKSATPVSRATRTLTDEAKASWEVGRNAGFKNCLEIRRCHVAA